MRILFVMDPLELIKPEKDTSYVLMRAALARGHEVGYVPNNGVHLSAGKVSFDGLWLRAGEGKALFDIREAFEVSGEAIDAVFIRTDPPFDEAYLLTTWMLEQLPASVFVVNRPDGIRSVNEKVWATQFADLVPATLVTADLKRMQAFMREQGEVVLKPTDGFGGASVFRLSSGDSNAAVACETLSRNGTRPVILQAYEADAEKGDKRVLLLEGEPLGAILRVHAEGEHRNNVAAGGCAQPAKLDTRDRAIVERLAPYLCELGLWFVGLDIIGGKLIEVNVTSPTCLQELSRFEAHDFAADIIEWTEKKQGMGVG